MIKAIKIAFRFFYKEITRDYLCFSGMQVGAFLLGVIFIFSCQGQSKKDLSQDGVSEGQTIPAGKPEIDMTAGDPTFVVRQDTVSKHGPRSITRGVLQDKRGNYWFATWEGIVHYNGQVFTYVTLKEGLRHFRVFSIIEDKAGNMWFGTLGGGVYRYDGQSYTLFTTADGLVDNQVLCMLEDKDGNIWFGTRHGVSAYNGQTFTNFTKQEGLNDNFVSSIAQDKAGKIWFGTDGGVDYYDPSASLFSGKKSFTSLKNEAGLNFNNVRSIIEDKAGNIWIGGQDGLYRYNATDLQRLGGKPLTNLTTNYIGNMLEDKSGNLWLSGGQGATTVMTLSRYNGKSISQVTTKPQVFGLCEDKAGNIWFGTVSGVCRYDGKSFTNFLD